MAIRAVITQQLKEGQRMGTYPSYHGIEGRHGARSGERQRALGLVLCLAMLLAAAAGLPSAASAAQAHFFSESFGEAGSGAGQLELVAPNLSANPKLGGSGVAVDDATGDVYVADTGNHRIDVFEADGTFMMAWGWGVADGASEPQTCTLVCQAGGAGSGAGEFEAPTFVAVDNAAGGEGDVYVGDSGRATVEKFTAGGVFISSNDGSAAAEGPFAGIDGITVDGSGTLWVFDPTSRVFKFDRAGAPIEPGLFTNGATPSGIVATGPDEFFVADGFAAVSKIDAAGGQIGYRVTPSPSSEGGREVTGLSLSAPTDDLYVDEGGSAIADIPLATCEPAVSLCPVSQAFGEGHLSEAAGIAVDSGPGPAAGTVYAASAGEDRIAVFPVAVEANVEAATAITATTAVLHGTVDPEGQELSRCAFEYGEGSAVAQGTVPCVETPAQIGSGTSPVAVHADLSGLRGGTTYHFRLRATNAKGDVKSGEESLSTLTLPVIEGAVAEDITAGSATLSAQINPKGLATGCELEWGTNATYGTTVPCEPAGLGSGAGAVPVSVHLEGLSPNTTYHFRFRATSSNGTALDSDHSFVFLTGNPVQSGCPNEALRQANGSSALPDCRAYELVTPAQKNGALIGALFLGQVAPQISSSGEVVMAPSIQCFGGALSCVATRQNEGALFEFARTGSGWATNPLAPPASLFQTNSWFSFNPNVGDALYLTPNSAGGNDFYVRSPDGSLDRVGDFGEGEAQFNLQSAAVPAISTGDYSHLVYGTTRPIWAFDEGSQNPFAPSAYEYARPYAATPFLVGVSGGQGSRDLISRCGTSIGGPILASANQYGSLSADGQTVYFTAAACQSGSGANAGNPVVTEELFARIDGEGPAAHTVSISQPNALLPGPPNDSCTSEECSSNTAATPVGKASWRDGNFEGASTDGSRAFFTSTQQLTDEASQDPHRSDTALNCSLATGANACNLYLYDFDAPEGHHLTDVSAGAKITGGPRVQGMVALSPDGSHAYFVAKGVLTEAPNGRGQVAVEGADNLYLYERDAEHPSGNLTFVAGLTGSDEENWLIAGGQGLGVANVTPDGRYLVFTSHRGLTADARPGEGASQVYRYDALSEELTRISISARGFNDDGNSGVHDASIAPAFHAFNLASGPAKADPTMSDDGSYVFFQSPVALTPGALNEAQSGFNPPQFAQNIYEWEQQGTGGCTEPSGCVTLLSDGKEVVEGGKINVNSAELLGTDAGGKNVFIAAADPLTWQDTDSQRDYYDLRIEGGFMPPAEVVPCGGDDCKGTGTQAAAAPPPATPSVNGPGNVKPPAKCGKGRVRKGGKCVKKAKLKKKNRHKKADGKHHRHGKKKGGSDRRKGK
jgi:hypothetical protein